MILQTVVCAALLVPSLALAQSPPSTAPPHPQVGPVIDTALGKGANRIQALEFYSSNTDAGRRQALAEAIGKARGDAEAMARAAGGKLGPLVEASTTESGPRPLYRLAGVSDKS